MAVAADEEQETVAAAALADEEQPTVAAAVGDGVKTLPLPSHPLSHMAIVCCRLPP